MSDEPPIIDELTLNVLAVVESSLNLGVAVSRGFAELAAGRPVPPPAVSGPIPAMLHYALETTREIAAFTPFKPARKANAAATGSAPAGSTAAPRVQAGATLRIPLSIENPGLQPMQDLRPSLQSVQRDGMDAGSELTPGSVKFAPECLTVEPRDLEKLTVLITPPATAMAGRYQIHFVLRAGDPPIPIVFEVTAASPADVTAASPAKGIAAG